MAASAQAAGRAAEGVDAGDRLLAAVAALVEVDGRTDPAHLVGDRSVVRVDAEPGLAALDAEGVVRPEASGGASSFGVLTEA